MMTMSGYQATDAAAYDRFIGRWTARLADAIAAQAPLPHGACLDVGCGTGNMTAALRSIDAGRKLVGVDVAQPYLDHAAARPDCAGAKFLRMDAHDLSFPDDTFGASLATIALNFMTQPAAALSEMARVTRPGGTVLGAVWDFRGGLVYQRLLWDTAAVLDADAAALRGRLFSHPLAVPGGLATLWNRCGLDDVNCKSITIRMDFRNFDDYWLPLLGGQGPVAGYVAGLSEDLRAKIMTAVRDAYLSGDTDGPRALAATAWVVRGTVPARD